MTDILISAGHTQKSPGAMYEDFVEHEEAAVWSDVIVGLLRNDVSAELVPSGPLKEKIKYINDKKPRLAVELHFNDAVKVLRKDAVGEEEATLHIGRGCETLYCPGSRLGRVAAQIVQNSITGLFLPDRGIKEGYYRMDPSNGPDSFLSRTNCTAIIVEPDFVARYKLIRQNRDSACEKLAQGILSAFRVLSNY